MSEDTLSVRKCPAADTCISPKAGEPGNGLVGAYWGPACAPASGLSGDPPDALKATGETVGIEIRETETLDEADYRALHDWGDDIFGAGSLEMTWRRKDHHLVAYVDGSVASHVGLLKQWVTAGGRRWLVGGIGGVVTVPEHQRQGLATMLLRRAAEVLEREWRADAGLLFCGPHMVPFYALLGWRQIMGPIMVNQPGGRVACPTQVMVLRFGDWEWPAGPFDVPSLPW